MNHNSVSNPFLLMVSDLTNKAIERINNTSEMKARFLDGKFIFDINNEFHKAFIDEIGRCRYFFENMKHTIEDMEMEEICKRTGQGAEFKTVYDKFLNLRKELDEMVQSLIAKDEAFRTALNTPDNPSNFLIETPDGKVLDSKAPRL